jgi:glucoamylase
MQSLADWIERQYRYAATAMLMSLSREDLVKSRPGFGQSIRARRGSIVASPVLGDWNPHPDYFFHWFRDSSVVLDALRMLFEAGHVGAEAIGHVRDFVQFSLSLQKLEGRTLTAEPIWRTHVAMDFVRFLREEAELAAVQGEGVVAETRVNPDGTLDISHWGRPQHDGAPLRALALMRWAHSVSLDAELNTDLAALVRSDLAFTFRHWRLPAFDMWEEEKGLHYHTLCVSGAALAAGSQWLQARGDHDEAARYRSESEHIHAKLNEFWMPQEQFYRSRMLDSGARSEKDLDIAVILAPIHAAGDGPVHSARDPRIHATLDKLEALFDAAYPINHNRPADRAAAMGRYAGDQYYSGGAYYFSTLGAAELCYRAAAGMPERANEWMKRGDGFLQTVRAFTPPDGQMSEQFDQRTGEQTSARHLAWSYAALISCVNARRALT